MDFAIWTDCSTLTSLSEEAQINEINLFPNPAQQVLFLNNNPIGVYRIYDLSGKLITENSLFNSNTSIDVDYLQNGLYMLEINNEGKLFRSKFIKD